MGVLTQLLVESPKKIKKNWKSAFDDPAIEYSVASVLHQNSLASLLAVVRQCDDFHEDRFLEEIETPHVMDDGEISFAKVPFEIVSTLADVSKKDLKKLAKRWKKTDLYFKTAGDDVTKEHLVIVLRSMRKASKEAVKSAKQVYVCCCT